MKYEKNSGKNTLFIGEKREVGAFSLLVVVAIACINSVLSSKELRTEELFFIASSISFLILNGKRR